jgi:hypothetical protein
MSSKLKLNLSDTFVDKKVQNLITDIEKISLEEKKEDNNYSLPSIDDDKLYEIIFDMDNSEDMRIQALNRYVQINEEYIIEIVNRLNSMYIFSYTKILQNYLVKIIYESKIDPVLKLESAKVLADQVDIGYDCIDYICRTYLLMPTPSRHDAITYLMNSEKYKNESLKYFDELVNDKSIDNYYRYKCILNLENSVKNRDNLPFFMIPILKSFMTNDRNITRVRILCCQYTIKLYNELYDLSINTLFSFADDADLDYNLRADAVDVLLREQNNNIVQRAQNILLELAKQGKVIRTVYDNAQNVHSEAIEDSAISILEGISNVCQRVGITFDDVRSALLEAIKDDDKQRREKIEMSLTRIYLDRSVYGKFNISLIGILCKVWAYITCSEYSDVMTHRLLDELYDASEVCSTGYAFRILNTLSGFTEFSIKISFQDQIIANLQGRLNARIKLIEDDEYMTKIIEEMMIPTEHYHSRPNFLRFFRESIPSIRQEMYEEFKDYMEDVDYDLYFRKAIFKYEGME